MYLTGPGRNLVTAVEKELVTLLPKPKSFTPRTRLRGAIETAVPVEVSRFLLRLLKSQNVAIPYA